MVTIELNKDLQAARAELEQRQHSLLVMTSAVVGSALEGFQFIPDRFRQGKAIEYHTPRIRLPETEILDPYSTRGDKIKRQVAASIFLHYDNAVASGVSEDLTDDVPTPDRATIDFYPVVAGTLEDRDYVTYRTRGISGQVINTYDTPIGSITFPTFTGNRLSSEAVADGNAQADLYEGLLSHVAWALDSPAMNPLPA